MRDGALEGFGALIGKNGRLAASSAQRVNGNTRDRPPHHLFTPARSATSRASARPLWQVKAERVVYDQTKHKVRFRNAIIEVEGVPVALLPPICRCLIPRCAMPAAC